MARTMMDVVNDVNTLNAEVEKDGKRIFKEWLASAFDTLPVEITAIRWRQFAPYFNDGEACVFSTHDPDYLFAEPAELKATEADEGDESDGEDDDGGDEDGFTDGWDAREANKGMGATLDKFEADFHSIPDDIFESAFGSDSIVTVTRTKKGSVQIVVADYTEHD